MVLGFTDLILGFVLGFRVYGFGFRVHVYGFRVYDFQNEILKTFSKFCNGEGQSIDVEMP